jgi:ABC-type multidrug transport system fused ATPase/permease subunit
MREDWQVSLHSGTTPMKQAFFLSDPAVKTETNNSPSVSRSGKSSIILLLLRLLDPIGSRNGDRSQENLGDINDENTLSIDGLSLRHVDRAALRRAVITVPQDPAFLPGGSTVRQNLDPLDAASDEDCAAVLARVGLSDLLLPGSGGLGRGMSADSLSAGQQRLFALAGAVLRAHVKRKASSRCGTSGGGGLLLLDEVNFATDEDTERKIRDVIRHEFADYTVIMVSHQLGLVVDLCQRVVVLDRGAVVEQGDPAQLSKQLGSRFGRLWEAQRQERK